MLVLDRGFVELIDHMGDDSKVVKSARVSYLGSSSSEERDSKLISYLLENGHTSPFEHVVFTFVVKAPLFVARQWMRHRTWSFNEVSRRYTSDEMDFYIPTFLRRQSDDNKQMSTDETLDKIGLVSVENALRNYSEECLCLYETLTVQGVAREQARMVLPQNMYTKFYATVDLHNLLHFLKLRNHPHSQWEIQQYALAIEQLIEPIVPVSLNKWKSIINR